VPKGLVGSEPAEGPPVPSGQGEGAQGPYVTYKNVLVFFMFSTASVRQNPGYDTEYA